MNLTIYHGSDHIIKKPEYGLGKPYNDYGKGFYCTESLCMAKEWAVKDKVDGWINCYQINDSGLRMLNLNSGEYSILHWLTILLENRDFQVKTPLAVEAKRYLLQAFHVDISEYDCIKGYRADDSYFSFAKDFVNGVISLRQLDYAMKLGKLGEQIMIKSEDAFARMEFVSFEKVNCNEWYPKRKARDDVARKDYFDLDKNQYVRGDIYITRILDEEIDANDPRIS